MIGLASGDRSVNDQLVTMSELVDVGAQRCRRSSEPMSLRDLEVALTVLAEAGRSPDFAISGCQRR
jgi:hypothetical protein